MSEKRCGDCEYFVAFRNYNYETCTNDTITEYCELLQNEETYDRDKGDEIWNDVFDDCPLETGYVSTESAILLLQSKEEVHKFFDNYVRSSCEKEKKLQDENEQLRKQVESSATTSNATSHYNAFLESKITTLEEENEQLQKTINEVIELLTEEVDLFSDKATEHDIIAYKEMNEFDNKDAYYMCISTKKAIKMLQRCL